MAEEQMIIPSTQRYCSKCRRTMALDNFYTYKNGEKCELCKGCLTMHINNFEPETYLWLLEKFDVPYVEGEWNVLRDRAYQKDPYKINGMSVFGKYLSKMKLKQWNKYTWADTEMLAEKAKLTAQEYGNDEEQRKQKLEEMRAAFDRGEITEAQLKTYEDTHPPEPKPEIIDAENSAYPQNSNFEQVDLPDVGNDLTEEDKIYLAVKWGRFYKAEEWVYLEQKYNEFMNTFDIQGAARIDTLIMICKTSLKMNQAIDCGDIDSYQKLSRVYDALMKSAKFTEAQNKEDKAGQFDSVGSIIAFCEKEGGFIPEYEIKVDKDMIDSILRDSHEYLENLINKDTNLSQQIEQFLQKKTNLYETKIAKLEDQLRGTNSEIVEDEDYDEFFSFINESKEADKITMAEDDEEEVEE